MSSLSCLLLTLNVLFLGCSLVCGGPVITTARENRVAHLPNIIHLGVKVLHGPQDNVEYKIPEVADPKIAPVSIGAVDDGSDEPMKIGVEGGDDLVPAPVKIGTESDGAPPPPIITIGGKEGELTPEPIGKPPCIAMTYYDAELYEYYGCEIAEVLEGCYTKPICPEACTAEDGTLKEHNGPMWMEKEEKSMCECVTSNMVLANPPVPPPGAAPWPPYKHCRPNGCTMPGSDIFIPGGRSFMMNGDPCFCLEGPDPNMMDYSFLYHLKCYGESNSVEEFGEVMADEAPVPVEK